MTTRYWLGSEQTLQEVDSATQALEQQILAGTLSYIDDEDESDDELGPNTQLVGNIAVSNISGKLVNEDVWYNAYRGCVSYAEIGRNLLAASSHSEVKAIVLNVGSGGGSPNGLLDTMKIIELISQSGIPVYAYTGSCMASAAYFLCLPCDGIYAGEMAITGSIGTISTHQEMTKMYQDMGITTHITRSGQFKGLGGPFEKLSQLAKDEIQQGVDYLTEIFTSYVAKCRGKTEAYVTESMAQGREFIGQQGADVGIIDGVTTLDSLISKIQTQIARQENPTMAVKKRTTPLMSAQTQALVAEGVPLEQAMALQSEQEAAPAEVPASKQETPTAIVDPDPVPAAASNDLVSYLQGQLVELPKITMERDNLQATVASLTTQLEAVRGVVIERLEHMSVAIGSAKLDYSKMPMDLIMVQHAQVRTAFMERFPVGGVAFSAEVSDDVIKTEASPARKVALRQAKVGK